MPTYDQGFSAIVAAIITAAVVGIGAGVVYVSSQNQTPAKQTATSTATTTNRPDNTAKNTPSNQTASSQVTVTGSVTGIDMSAMAVDGPAKITISVDSGETQTVRLPARAQQCSQTADVVSLNNISVGDQISVRGSQQAGEIAPCRLPDGFLRKESGNQAESDDQTTVDKAFTDTFRSQKFTATVRKESESVWQYEVSGSLPNPCWGYTVEADPVSPVASNQQQTYRISVTATPPGDDEVCSQVVQSVEGSGQIQNSTAAEVRFELRVDETGELPDLPS